MGNAMRNAMAAIIILTVGNLAIFAGYGLPTGSSGRLACMGLAVIFLVFSYCFHISRWYRRHSSKRQGVGTVSDTTRSESIALLLGYFLTVNVAVELIRTVWHFATVMFHLQVFSSIFS
jgi:hypothetical protein